MERTSVPVLEGEFLQLLGEGASGNVGLYQIDNQQYIIKTVTVNLGSNVSPKDKDLSCVIKNEIDILTKIKTFCSPFFLCLEKIRQNTDFKTNTKTVFLFFPDNPGFTPLSNISPLYNNIRDICRTCINLAKGLQTLHHHQLVHRDIKPHNILLNYESGAIKYIDFGGTCEEVGQDSRCSYMCRGGHLSYGTPMYSAPEQTLSHNAVYKIDVWGLGIVFFYILSQGDDPWPRNIESSRDYYKYIQDLCNSSEPPYNCITAAERERVNGVFLNAKIAGTNRPTLDAKLGGQLFILIQKMTRVFPTQRLTIDEVCKKLDVLKAHFELNFEEEKLT